MRIACIGWGSLVWQPGVLRCGPWQEEGPLLPLEFARTSRDGRLTLVLTPGEAPLPTLWCELDYASPEQAQDALAGREGSGLRAIGLWPGSTPAHNLGTSTIADWAATRGFNAVVWTALGPKFNGVDGKRPENAAAAVEYLRQLNAETFAKAREYVTRAPLQIRTAFRTAFEEELGWKPEVAPNSVPDGKV